MMTDGVGVCGRGGAKRALSFALSIALMAVLVSQQALAIEVPGDEKARLKGCEKRLCAIILAREPEGDDLACDITKTWAEKSIKGGVERGTVSWSLGDAQCKVKISMKRAAIIAALTQPKYRLVVAPHKLNCRVEDDGDITKVSLTIAPRVTFKNGRAVKGKFGLRDIKAPALIKGAIWTVNKLEKNFGLFEEDLLKEVNKFVHKKCAKRYGK